MSQRTARGDISEGTNNRPYVFLDCGGLILDYTFNQDTLMRAHREACARLNTSEGVNVSLDEVIKAHRNAIAQYLKARKNHTEWTIYKLTGLMLEELGLKGKVFSSTLPFIYKLHDHDVKPRESTLESIPELQMAARLGIISDSPHDSAEYELIRYGMTRVFDPIVFSFQVGHRKPHPAIYKEALRKADLLKTPEQATFFSHDQEEVDGALAVGMQAHLAFNLAEVLSKLKGDGE